MSERERRTAVDSDIKELRPTCVPFLRGSVFRPFPARGPRHALRQRLFQISLFVRTCSSWPARRQYNAVFTLYHPRPVSRPFIASPDCSMCPRHVFRPIPDNSVSAAIVSFNEVGHWALHGSSYRSIKQSFTIDPHTFLSSSTSRSGIPRGPS